LRIGVVMGLAGLDRKKGLQVQSCSPDPFFRSSGATTADLF
jgi:hypothetical protein